MQSFLNVLAAVVLAVVLVLRREFQALIDGDWSNARRLRSLLAPAMVVIVGFVAVASWVLVESGYFVVAILLLAHLALMFEGAWRKSSGASDGPDR